MRKETRKETRLAGLRYWPVLVVVIDLALKWWVREDGVYVVNKGIAWGWLAGENGWWWSGVILIALIAWSVMKMREEERWLLWGGVGNLIDRLVWGGVTDYLHIDRVNLWFNGADLLICVAVGALVINLGKDESRRTESSI